MPRPVVIGLYRVNRARQRHAFAMLDTEREVAVERLFSVHRGVSLASWRLTPGLLWRIRAGFAERGEAPSRAAGSFLY